MQIAIVDPSRTVRRIVKGMVESWGYSAADFCNGEQALGQLARHDDVRTLITSVELPGFSGLELCGSARKIVGTRRPLYILLMSSSNETERVVAALENGADDFISKPPSPEELKARLRAADRVTSMQATLAGQAITDSLTDLMNRRGFFDRAAKLWKSVAEGHKVSAIILDIDKFKAVNDQYGHAVGDDVLAAIAEQTRKYSASAARLGGDEFALLVECPLDAALDKGEQLRAAVEGLAIQTDGRTICPTSSIGVAESEPGDSIDTLMRRADMALYEAKRQGRNRVVAADTYRTCGEHRKWKGVARTRARPGSVSENTQRAAV